MRKGLKFLLLLAPITTLATPILAASCDKKESNQEKNIKDDSKEKKEFKERIEQEEANLKSNLSLSEKVKKELEALIKDAKDKLEKSMSPKEFNKTKEEFNKKIEEIKKEETKNKPEVPKKPTDSESNNQGGGTNKPEGNSMTPGDGKEPKEEKKPETEESNPPATPPTIQPTPPSEAMPSDQPGKEEHEEINEKDLTELDKIAKELNDILINASAIEDLEELKKLKDNSSAYSLWYSSVERNILLVKGDKSPFAKDFDKDNKLVLFALQKADQIKDNIQLVNDKNPIIEVNDDDKKQKQLSNKLDFDITKKEKNKFDITLKYKVGKKLGKEIDPEVSKLSNQSTITITL
ncbi:Hypothetical protein, predicted lipoprotein [Metamycoplasma auris 15026]|uniref:Uncharacterized protein n=1 Tax=Metamycoplasma auris 15026 TaxID=1188233 RepID=N9TSS7_9BACT|nr:variable surface lipoprotein [Metamycoplasma auris]ENY69184.1 Hypothetical protein, predicted lipoprotein [Metamycoplasma auris 15026]